MKPFLRTSPNVPLLCLILICAPLICPDARGQGSEEFPIEVIAVTTRPNAPIPGGVFLELSGPIISETGAVCFAGIGATLQESAGIWTNFTGELLPVMINGDTVANVTSATVTVTRGSRVQSLSGFAINSFGDVAFRAIADPGADAVCISSDREGIRLRASQTASFPGDVTFETVNFLGPLLDNNGGIVFGDSRSEIWRVDARGLFRLVTTDDGPAPGFPGQFFTGFSNVQLNSAGTLALSGAALEPGAMPQDFVTGIWTDSEGRFELLVGSGTQLPGMPANAESGVGNLFWINDLGAVAFDGSWEAEGPMGSSMAERALYVVEPDGAIRKEVTFFEENDLTVLDARVISNGTVYYQAFLNSTTVEIRRSGTPILATGNPVPGSTPTETFAGFNVWTVNNRGQVVVESIVQGPGVTSENDRGIYAILEDDKPVKVIREGDEIEIAPGNSRTVVDIFLLDPRPGSNRIFSDNGLLTFQVEFDDTTRAILVAGEKIESEEFIVNSTDDNDDGTCNVSHCSLREAINAANTREGPDTVTFAIPQKGTSHTIRPITPFPTITDEVDIDGTSQEGYQGEPIIILDGAAAGTLDTFQGGLTLGKEAHFCKITGLVIHNFAGNGIHIDEGSFHEIGNCYIGTTPNGMAPSANLGHGVSLFDSSFNMIGGTTPADQNLISGNSNGIVMAGNGSNGNLVVGNIIGLNKSTNDTIANTFDGVRLRLGANNNTFGGTADGASNIIAGNGSTASLMGGNGVLISGTGTTNNRILGNEIGSFDLASGRCLGNVRSGILVEEDAAGNEIRANRIICNNDDGVTLQSGRGNSVRLNSIVDNGQDPNDLPIDLVGEDGPDENDSGDGDTGPNDLLNVPELSSANIFLSTGSSGYDPFLNVRGDLDVPSSIEYLLDVYSGRGCQQTAVYLGTVAIPVPDVIPFQFEVKVPGQPAPFSNITATLTDPEGNTSEVGCIPLGMVFSERERFELLFDGATRWRGVAEMAPLDERGLLGLVTFWEEIAED